MGSLNFSLRFLIGAASLVCLILFLYSAPDSYFSMVLRILVKLSYFWCLFVFLFTTGSLRAFLAVYGAMGAAFLIFGDLWTDRPGQYFSDWGYIQAEFASILMERLGTEELFRTNPERANLAIKMISENVKITFQLTVSLLAAASAVWLYENKVAEENRMREKQLSEKTITV